MKRKRMPNVPYEPALPPGPPPFSPDHKVYPQGWSWAMIEREAARRYRSIRDEEREQDWTWAVDDPAVFTHMSKEARRAAHELYEHQQTAVGDTEHVEDLPYRGGFEYLGASWAQARSEQIAAHAKAYVHAHPQASDARLAVFACLFEVSKPTLTEIRWRARPNGPDYNRKGKRVYLNQREVVSRIVWCCEALADCDAGLTAGYGPVS